MDESQKAGNAENEEKISSLPIGCGVLRITIDSISPAATPSLQRENVNIYTNDSVAANIASGAAVSPTSQNDNDLVNDVQIIYWNGITQSRIPVEPANTQDS